MADRWTTQLVGHQRSGIFRALVDANALLVIPSEVKCVPASTWVEAWPLAKLLFYSYHILEEEFMPRIRCHYIDCVFLDDGYCGAAAIEVDPDVGCMTYARANDMEVEDEWEEEEEELHEWDETDLEEDEDELWLDEDEY